MGATSSIFASDFDKLALEAEKDPTTADVSDDELRETCIELRASVITVASIVQGAPGSRLDKLGLRVKAQLTVQNNVILEEPSRPNIIDNTLLFLPAKAVDELGLQPNLDDKGDDERTLWCGRVWQLRALLAKTHKAISEHVEAQDGSVTPERQAEVDEAMADPVKRSRFQRLIGKWRGTCLRRRQNLDFLNELRWANLKGTVVYAHGSGGMVGDNTRICRMLCGQGLLVVAPDGFAYPPNTSMIRFRCKKIKPLLVDSDDVDYWNNDLFYASAAVGDLTYNTKADDVLDDSEAFNDLYEKCYQLRRADLHYVIKRLPHYAKLQGFFLGGTSEGAMTIARFDDQRYGGQLIGRFINSFSIEYNYFTPTPEDGMLGGQTNVPTLNIIGTNDEYFGAIESVAKVVADSSGDPALEGHGYATLVSQGCSSALVAVLDEGVHGPCVTHDNFLREVFDVFFTRPGAIHQLPDIFNLEPSKAWMLQTVRSTSDDTSSCNVTHVHVNKMLFPSQISQREIDHMRNIQGLWFSKVKNTHKAALSRIHGPSDAYKLFNVEIEMEKQRESVEQKKTEIRKMITNLKDSGKSFTRIKPEKNNFYSGDKKKTVNKSIA
jgi:hypothetical protein